MAINNTSPTTSTQTQYISEFHPRIDGAGNRNYLLNSDFKLWRRGTSIAVPGTNTATYTADAWRVLADGGSATVSQQPFTFGQITVPGEPAYYLNINRVTGGTGTVLFTRIEDVRILAGRTGSYSVYLNPSIALSVTFIMIQGFGDASATSVSTTISTVNLSTGWQKVNLAGLIQLPSIAGKPVTDPNSFLSVWMRFNSGSNYTVGVAMPQLEDGTVVTRYRPKTPQEELLACMRYFEKSFDDTTAPATGLNNYQGTSMLQSAVAASKVCNCQVYYKVPKRTATSVVTFYNPVNANNQAYDFTALADCSSTSMARGNQQGFQFSARLPSTGAVGDSIFFQWSCDNEL